MKRLETPEQKTNRAVYGAVAVGGGESGYAPFSTASPGVVPYDVLGRAEVLRLREMSMIYHSSGVLWSENSAPAYDPYENI